MQLSVGAGLGVLLAACASEQTSPVGSTVPNKEASPGLSSMLADAATYAGRVSETGAAYFVLAAPVGSRALSVAGDFKLLDASGNPAGNQPPPAGSNVRVWTENDEAVTAQLLPPITATGEIPIDLSQPSPTYETIPLGSLPLITRAGWGAADKQFSADGESGLYDARSNPTGWLEYPLPLAEQLESLVIHHAAMEFDHGPQEIQRLHILQRGFADVGYHFLIDGLGQIYEGRPIGARGAHVGGYNTGAVGICLLGNFEEVGPLTSQMNSTRLLASYLRDTYQLSYLAGHRDYQPGETVCPGVNLWPLLPNLAAELDITFGIPAG